MPDFEKMYFHLFNSLSKAIEEADKTNFGRVREILIQAQQECEDMYMDEKAGTEE